MSSGKRTIEAVFPYLCHFGGCSCTLMKRKYGIFSQNILSGQNSNRLSPLYEQSMKRESSL